VKFTEQVRLGFNTYSDAHKFIFKNGLWGYLFIPGIINILLIVGVFMFASAFGGTISTWLLDLFALDSTWLKVLLGFFISLVIKLLLFLVYMLFYKYLVLIIMSPFLALLSERTEELLTGNEYPFNFSQFLRDVLRGIAIALRNMFLELLFVIGFYLLAFIPLVNLLGMLFLFLTQSYFYGFSMLDYSNERHKRSVRESVSFVRKFKWVAVSNGVVFYLLFIIPFAGWLVAPSYAVVAATLANHHLEKNNS